jgi:hypothetical protein
MIRTLLTFFIFTTALLSSHAQGEFVEVRFEGFTHGYSKFKQHADGLNITNAAGEFSLTDHTGASASNQWGQHTGEDQSVNVFCLEPHIHLPTNQTLTYMLQNGNEYFQSDTQIERIGQLFTGFYGNISQATSNYSRKMNSAAFQVALWELVYDYDSPNLYNGLHRERGRGNSVVGGIAQSWLSQLSGIQSNVDLFVLKKASSQNLIYARESNAINVPNTDIKDVSTPLMAGVLCVMSLGLFLKGRRQSRRTR